MKILISLLAMLLVIVSCGGNSEKQSVDSSTPPGASVVKDQDDQKKNKGIGPIKSVTLGEIDAEMAEEGKKLYNSMCTACHQIDQDYIGPSQKGILDRRSPEWVMNMILNPGEMLDKDPIAQKLLEEANGVRMAPMGLSEEETRKVLEYLRTL